MSGFVTGLDVRVFVPPSCILRKVGRRKTLPIYYVEYVGAVRVPFPFSPLVSPSLLPHLVPLLILYFLSSADCDDSPFRVLIHRSPHTLSFLVCSHASFSVQS